MRQPEEPVVKATHPSSRVRASPAPGPPTPPYGFRRSRRHPASRPVALVITFLVVLVGATVTFALGRVTAADDGRAAPADAGGAAQEAGSRHGTPEDLRAGLVADIEGFDGGKHNDLARSGLRRSSDELGVGSTRVLESATPTDHSVQLARLAADGFAPIFAIGPLMRDAVADTARRFPDRDFVMIGAVVDAPNVTSVTFRQEESSYLAGVLAGLMTTRDTPYTDPATMVIGFLGGRQDPRTMRVAAGYTAGARSVCPRCEVLVEYVGTTPDALDDPAAGQAAALRLNDGGADVVHHLASATGIGLLEVARDRGFFAIGSEGDDAALHANVPILTSTTMRFDNAVYGMVELAAAKRLPGGQVRALGVRAGGVDLAPFGAFDALVPTDVAKAVARARTGLGEGTIAVTDTAAR